MTMMALLRYFVRRSSWLPACVLALVISGCSEEDNSGTGPIVMTYAYEDFVHFDFTERRFSKRDYFGSASKIPEPIVNWEQSLGEPFTDVNGNGVYDSTVDTFVMSPDPDHNQDLNQNGRYDGPDDPWTPGIPFDDIDGNGEFRPDPGDHISGYVLGMPYADFNRDHTHDGDLKAIYGVMQWQTGSWYYGIKLHSLASCADAVYRFVSDSGLNYDLPFRFDPIMNPLADLDSGLFVEVGSNLIPLIRPGMIVPEERIEIVKDAYPNALTFYRTTTIGDSLMIDGAVYTGLVKVILEDLDERFIFYFARSTGAFAYEYWRDRSATPGTWIDFSQTVEYYHRRLTSTTPMIFPTTR